jgi:hypothetical protein
MNFLEQLLGGQAQRNEYQDLIKRYEQGHPSEGYTDQEVMDRYGQMASRLPRDVYKESAEEAFARLSPEEREQFFDFMRQRAQQKQVTVPGLNDGATSRSADPGSLAEVTTRAHEQQPGFLRDLLGGGGEIGKIFDNPLAKAALVGITAIAAKKIMDSRRQAA